MVNETDNHLDSQPTGSQLRPGVRPDAGFRLFDRELKFRGRVVGVSLDHCRFPNGHETRHEVIHLPSAVCVVPLLDSPGGSHDVVLIDQFRNSVEGYIHEIPAGILEPGEDPAECAGRELKEETGFMATTITHLTTLFPIPGTSAHQMHFYLAEGLTPGPQRLESAECLTVRTYPLTELLESLIGKQPPIIVDAKTHVGLLHTYLRLLRRGSGTS